MKMPLNNFCKLQCTKAERQAASGRNTSIRHEIKMCITTVKLVFTAQRTLVHMRGLGIACRPSVRPSVRLSVRPSVTLVICDHIGWKSWKLTARTISPTPSLIVAKRRSTYSQGNMGKFGETRGVVGEKWHTGEQKR